METIRITDVSPRDGLQNEPRHVPTLDKLELITRLIAANLDEVEVTSFVSKAWVPQLGDAPQLCAGLADYLGRHPSLTHTLFSALVPNEKGLDAALAANAAALPTLGRLLLAKVSVFTAASETFCQRNINASITQSIQRFAPVVARAHSAGLKVRAYISCVIACPFEGPITPDAVAALADQLLGLNVDEIDLGDTIGAATPASLAALLAPLLHLCHTTPLTLHLHDTRGGASACLREALHMGIRSFDGAIGGLGGCPYASTPTTRAPGNIDTATLISVASALGYGTNVKDLGPPRQWATHLLTQPLPSVLS